MNTSPNRMMVIALCSLAAIVLIQLLTGCDGTSRTLHPSQVKVYTLAGDVHAEVTGSENTQGGRFQVHRKADGTVTLDYRDKGSQWFSVPDFTGENWTMYAGIGIAVLGVGMFFFPITAPLAGWVIAGGIGLIAFGSWLKTDYAPIITTGLIVAGLAYAYWRNRKALSNVMAGVNTSETAKAAVYQSTDHSDDKLIEKL